MEKFNRKQTKQRKTKNKRRKNKGGMLKKNPHLTTWQAVYKMICNPTATLRQISFTSVKGFIFRLDVAKDPVNAEFFGLNDVGTSFTKPVYSLIFKFAVIGRDATDLELPNLIIPGDKDEYGRRMRYGRFKETETMDAFKTEATAQQIIYSQTVNPIGHPVCLAVVDFSTFDAPSSTALLDNLLMLSGGNLIATTMINYLKRNVNEGRRLGLITMELANPQFRELKSIPIGSLDYSRGCEYGLAQIFVLIAKMKIINYDWHLGNILAFDSRFVPPETTSNKPSIMIDFGRPTDLMENPPFPEEAETIVGKYNRFSGTVFSEDLEKIRQISLIKDLYVGLGKRGKPQDNDALSGPIIEKMHEIIKFLAYLDYATNTTYFYMGDEIGFDRPQLIDLLEYIYGPGIISKRWTHSGVEEVRRSFVLNDNARRVYFNVIKLIREMTEISESLIRDTRITGAHFLSTSTIDKHIREGNMYNPTSPYDRSERGTWRVEGLPGDVGYLPRRGGKTKKRKIIKPRSIKNRY